MKKAYISFYYNIKIWSLVIFALSLFGLIFVSPALAAEPICPGGSNPDSNVVWCDDFEDGTWQDTWDENSGNDPVEGREAVRCDSNVFGFNDKCSAYSGNLYFDGYWGYDNHYGSRSLSSVNTELYLRMYVYFSNPYPWGNTNDKGIYFGRDAAGSFGGSEGVYMKYNAYGTGKPNISSYLFGLSPNNPTDNNRYQNQGNDIIFQPGKWYLVEFYMKLNTPGVRDGIVKLWIDDASVPITSQTLRLSYNDLQMRNSSQTWGYDTVYLTDYHQRCDLGSACPSILYQWVKWDNMIISKSSIGPSGVTPPPPDTQAPTIPTNLTATAISSSQINLSWSASTDDVGVTGYRVERCQGSTCTNFTQIAAPTGTSYSDTGLLASTAYRYQARTQDAAGNLSNYSSIASATTQAAPPPDINANLISHWKFDEGSGTAASDTSGNNNNLSISGASWTTGQVSGALSFDGVNDLAECSDTNCGGTTTGGLDMGTRDWTTTAWIKTTATSSGVIVAKGGFVGGSNPDSWSVSVFPTGRLGAGIWDTSLGGNNWINSTNDGVIINNSAWHHIAVVFDRDGNMIRYVDGQQTGTQNNIVSYNNIIIDNTKSLKIGSRDESADPIYFNGSIDEVRVYNRALTASEIQMIYNLVITPDTTPPSAPTGLIVQ